RHIPVQIISTEEDMYRGRRMGAMGALNKPLKSRDALDDAMQQVRQMIDPRLKNVLIVGYDEARRREIEKLLAGDAVRLLVADTVGKAMTMLDETAVDLIVAHNHEPNSGVFKL